MNLALTNGTTKIPPKIHHLLLAPDSAAASKPPLQRLNYAAVGTVRRQVIGLVEEPNTFPFIENGPHVFRNVD
jgi:hypothetical protein